MTIFGGLGVAMPSSCCKPSVAGAPSSDCGEAATVPATAAGAREIATKTVLSRTARKPTNRASHREP